MNEAKEL